MQPLQLSDEILLLALLPLCPLPCALQLAAVARRAGPGQLTTHDLVRRCVDLLERVLTVLSPVLWEGLRGGRRSDDFAPHVARRLCCAESTNLARRPHTPPGCPVFRGDSEVFLLQTASPARALRCFCGGNRGAASGSAVATGTRPSWLSSRWRTARELLCFPSARRPVIGPTSLRCECWRQSA